MCMNSGCPVPVAKVNSCTDTCYMYMCPRGMRWNEEEV